MPSLNEKTYGTGAEIATETRNVKRGIWKKETAPAIESLAEDAGRYCRKECAPECAVGEDELDAPPRFKTTRGFLSGELPGQERARDARHMDVHDPGDRMATGRHQAVEEIE